MDTTNKLARISGFLYLIVIVTGIVGLIYIPSTLIDWSNSAATVENIKASEALFRFSIICSAITYTAFLIMGLTLFELFKSTDVRYALSLLVFVTVGVALGIASIGNSVNVLTLVSGADYLQAIPNDQLQAQVMYLLTAQNNEYLVGDVFWGLWLLPFGYLVYKSGFLPKLLGIALMLGCFDYLIDLVLRLQFSVENVPFYFSVASTTGEFGICLWLLLVGARNTEVSGKAPL